ncbi:hypothetical protein [Paracoccus beibuensis]|uniref:hypothetical protein n=1 Tax=Paracoccus beibuensis TaxID=547602 RepID=UPI002240DAE2|nr:hypothetical protein [Paracoccus beibuensis]
MKRLVDRRMILLAGASAAVTRVALADAARPAEITVKIGFEGGKPIPKGRLVAYLEGPAEAQHVAARADTESNGKPREIRIPLPLPPGTDMSSPRQVVAELQRDDGWLLARGSAQVEEGLSAVITLYIVMY